MAKQIGLVALNGASALYTPAVGIVPFTNRGGPAHHLAPGAPDVDTAGVFSSIAGTEADAWTTSGDPSFIGDAATSSRYYEWTKTALGGTFPLSAYPFSIGIVIKATTSNPGWQFALYNSLDTSQYIIFRSGNSSFIKITAEIKDGTTAYKTEIAGTGLFTSGVWYSFVITVADNGSGKGTGMTIYKDDVALITATTNDALTAFPTGLDTIRVGTATAVKASSYSFGNIDFFGMFNTVLSSTNRAKIYNDFAAGATPTWGFFVPAVVTQDIAGTGLITETTTAGIESALVAARRVIPVRPPLQMDLSARPLVGRGAERGL